ncbi:MAG: metal-sensitive transcriptional regulator [Firmicutes bacterium]|nr:metal-sensitive transcriptional regulator [Bacillota bacterium]
MSSYADDKDALLKRLRRIEGQVRGIQRMIEDDKYCVDILVQIAAVRSAMDRVGLILLENHTRGCVARALRQGGDGGEEAIAELSDVLKRFVR